MSSARIPVWSTYFLHLLIQLRALKLAWICPWTYSESWLEPADGSIEVPEKFGLEESTLLDVVPNQRKALVWLIEALPKVSEIKAALENGKRLHDIEAPSGSIGVLRWVIGSCRAYLKETKPGEGVLNAMTENSWSHGRAAVVGGQCIRQFTFVVGSPEIEEGFKGEIEKAKTTDANCKKFPTILAFHGESVVLSTLMAGSGAERWHNILRTGLDFQEVANARVREQEQYRADSRRELTSY